MRVVEIRPPFIPAPSPLTFHGNYLGDTSLRFLDLEVSSDRPEVEHKIANVGLAIAVAVAVPVVVGALIDLFRS